MRLLLDSCVWGLAADDLRTAGHDVARVADLGADPGDEEVLQKGLRENRVLVTLDKDFGELVFVLGRPHHGILRLVNVRARDQSRVILRTLESHGDALETGALVVAETDRVRIRRPAGEP